MHRVAWDPSGRRLVVGSAFRVMVVDADTGTTLATKSFGKSDASVADLAWSPDGERFAAACLDDTTRVFTLP